MNTSMLNFRSSMIVILLLVGMAAIPLASLANINGSRHDLSVGKGASYGYNVNFANDNHVCVYCHTPHYPNTNNGGKLLWDRSFSTTTYALYSSPSLESMSAQPSASLSYSLLCLSCHDGTIAIGSLANMTNQLFKSGSNYDRMSGYANRMGAYSEAKGVFLGVGLSNNHPIGMVYDNTINPALNPEGAIIVAGLKLYDGNVECATCHDPHNDNNSAFIRISNMKSALCTTCHIK